MKKITITLLVVCLLTFPILGVSADHNDLHTIEERGTLIVGSDTAYAPFEYLEDGEPTGFDYDFALELGVELDVSIDFTSQVWDSIIPTLQNGEFDVIISAMTITDDRDEQIDFSKPYYNSSQGILVTEGNPLGIENVEDLNSSDITIGVQTGTTSDIYATENLQQANIERLESFDQLYPKLDLGEIDVILGDAPVIGYAASTGAVGGELVGTFGSAEQFGVGIRSGETELQTALNDAIDAIIADCRYNLLTQKWFGYDAVAACDSTAELFTPASNTEESPINPLFALFGLLAIATVSKRMSRN